VFHSAQSGHWPCQRFESEPQAWQTYRVFGFAIVGEQYTNIRAAEALNSSGVAASAPSR